LAAQSVLVALHGLSWNKTWRNPYMSNLIPINAMGAGGPKMVNRDVLAAKLTGDTKIIG
jgi:hypothetical protein